MVLLNVSLAAILAAALFLSLVLPAMMPYAVSHADAHPVVVSNVLQLLDHVLLGGALRGALIWEISHHLPILLGDLV